MPPLSPTLAAPPVPDLQGQAKLREVQRLLDKLHADLCSICLLPHQRDAALEQLKVYGRDPQNADPIFTKEGIETLTRHALNSPSYTTSRHALRCLANTMLLRPATRQMFVDLRYESKLCSRLKHDDRDDEFLVGRIIFLTTYGTNTNIEELIDQHHLADTVCHNISRHTASYDEKKKKKVKPDPMAEMALVESVKLVFNLTYHCPQRVKSFTPAIPHIATILRKREVGSEQPLESPVGSLISSLLNLDLSSDDARHGLFPRSDPTALVERLIELLDLALAAYKEVDLDTQVTPIVTLLRLLYVEAPKVVRKTMKERLLPSDADRQQVLGKTDTLASRILRLTTAPMAPQMREEISTLLFTICDQDARKFTQAVGYGFASGFLFRRNIAVPENVMDAYGTSSSDARSSTSSRQQNINPVTGQAREFESKDQGPQMTQEEKEREAEKLMVLFERLVYPAHMLPRSKTDFLSIRLRTNGMIKAENPMAKMQREGKFEDSRFEEVDSDDD